MNDLDVNMAILGIFLNTTLRAAVHLGKDHDANSHYVKNHLWNRVGLLFDETGKLISEQKEITGVSTFQVVAVDLIFFDIFLGVGLFFFRKKIA